MTQNGVAAWVDPDGDGVAAATRNSAGGGGASIGTAIPLVDGTGSAGVGTAASAVDHIHPTDTTRAPLANPTFTGTPAGPTAAQGTNTTQLATTAMVHSEAALLAPLASPTFTGTVTLPASTVTSSMITDATIVDADVSATAGIIASKTFDREYYMNGKTFMRTNMTREAVRDAGGAAPATGVMMSVPLVLYKGDVVTNVIFESGTTAQITPTHWAFALYDTQATPALIAQTTDQGTAVWAATTVKSFALNAPGPYTVVTSGVHWASVWVAAATVNTFLGATLTSNGATGTANQVLLCQTSGSALTTTAPSTITGGTVKNAVPYARVT
jgi:hypothetical protein